MRALDGNTDNCLAANYMLFNHSDSYIGKAVLQRRSGAGIPRRLAEHIRCLLRPQLADGGKPRYRLLRVRLQQVRFVPTTFLQTLPQAYAAEPYLISVPLPRNVVDQHQ